MKIKLVGNTTAVAAGALLLLSSVNVSGAVTVEAGAAIVETSGLRLYAARAYLRENRTSSLTAPQLRVSVPVGESWTVGAGYGYYATFRGFGVSPDSDVFNQGGIASQVLTPFSSAEKIHEVNLDLRFRRALSESWMIEAGPTLSLFHSRATIFTRSFTANDVRLGGAAFVRASITEQWSVAAGYRYAAPPDRTFHLLTLIVARSF